MSSPPSNQLGILPQPSSPPQSAQPYRSIFGGPISQDVADWEPYPESDQGGGIDEAQGQDDRDIIMEEDEGDEYDNEEIFDDEPVVENFSDDDDATYHDSDENLNANDFDSDEDDASAPETERKRGTAQPTRSTTVTMDQSPSPPPYRPNRFKGPESTWRKLTLEDRQNAQALETIRARDLAAHLYNAYALRVRARDIARRAAAGDELRDEAEYFAPQKRWTAWPMPAEDVPRVDERLRREKYDEWTLRMQPDLRPSAELEESLIAIMQKTAKERFMAREWSGRGLQRRERRTSCSQPEDEGETTAFEAEWRNDLDSTDVVDLRPVVQTDDDISRRQLRPFSRRIITRFDQLLMGLHHARKATMGADDSSASERHTDTDSVVSGASSSPRKRRARRDVERSQSRGRKRTRRSSRHVRSRTRNASRSATESNEPSVASTSRVRSTSQHSSRSRGRSFDRDNRRLREGLRDWSDVSGIASMTGWPSEVVMRTAQRCAGLFGEDMQFRTFKEGKVGRDKVGDKTWAWQYAESDSDAPPPSTYRRKSRARQTPSQPASAKEDTGAEGTNDDGSQPPKGKGEHRKKDLVCPIKKCPRHFDGFSRKWNLNLHLKRVHPGYLERSASRKASSTRSLEVPLRDSETDDD